MNSLAKSVCRLIPATRRYSNVLVCHSVRTFGVLSAQPAVRTNDRRNTSHVDTSVPKLDDVLNITVRGMAGHSKWQNIRHIKSAKDDIKKKNTDKIVRRIKVAIQEGGSADPKFNSSLASALQAGKEFNVPNATMDNAIKGIEKARKEGKQIFVEGIGPGNFQLIIEVFTEKQKWARQEIVRVCKKYGAKVGEAGFASHSFEKKGVAQSPLVGDGAVDMDAAMDAAIEAGAEDVVLTTGDEDQKVFQFICDPSDLHSMKSNLEDLNYVLSSSRLQYVPSLFVPISPDMADLADKFFSDIEDLEFVIRIYDNIEVAESS